jgi:putative transposase
MARLARIVVPGVPQHVTQRGNRREPIFFEDGDQDVYRDLLAVYTRKAGVEVWAYCLMPNHVHLILVPSDGAGCPGNRHGAPALYPLHQRARALDRTSLPEPLRAGGNGRNAPVGRNTLCEP